MCDDMMNFMKNKPFPLPFIPSFQFTSKETGIWASRPELLEAKAAQVSTNSGLVTMVTHIFWLQLTLLGLAVTWLQSNNSAQEGTP